MATYTITTTVPQEAAMTRIVARVNADRVANGQAPYANNEEYFQAMLTATIQSYVREYREADAQAVHEAYAAATVAKQNQVKTALGL